MSPVIATTLDYSGALADDADYLKHVLRAPMYTPKQREAHKKLQKERKKERNRKRDQRRKR